MSVLSSLILILLSFQWILPFTLRELSGNDICKVMSGTLCIKETLTMVANRTTDIEHKLNKIEEIVL